MNANSFLLEASVSGADTSLIVDGQALCGCGFHFLCAHGLSLCFIRPLLMLKCHAVFWQYAEGKPAKSVLNWKLFNTLSFKCLCTAFFLHLACSVRCSTSSKVPSLTSTWHYRLLMHHRHTHEGKIQYALYVPADFSPLIFNKAWPYLNIATVTS